MQKITDEFENQLKLNQEDDVKENKQESHEENFSFAFDGVNFSTISAEDAFDNGQIKPVFPWFGGDRLLGGGEGSADVEDLDLESLRLKNRLPNVKNVFVVTNDDDDECTATTSSASVDEEIVGPYCEWSKKLVVEAAPRGCKKSNSTGFSKIWRFKEFMHRSNSDGRDAFVFLNHPTPSTTTSTAAPVVVSVKKEEKAVEGSPLKKVNENINGGVGGEARKVEKVKKNKKASLSPHEAYMRSKAKDADRRRSYLPYRPELVGLFTNVTGGGLSRNVHPF